MKSPKTKKSYESVEELFHRECRVLLAVPEEDLHVVLTVAVLTDPVSSAIDANLLLPLWFCRFRLCRPSPWLLGLTTRMVPSIARCANSMAQPGVCLGGLRRRPLTSPHHGGRG